MFGATDAWANQISDIRAYRRNCLYKSVCMFVRFWAYLYCLSKENTPIIFDIVEMSPWTVPRPREGLLDFLFYFLVKKCNVVVALCDYAATYMKVDKFNPILP